MIVKQKINSDFLPSLYSNNVRIPSIDRYRGLLLALMIAFGAAKMFEYVPFFELISTHDPSKAFLLLKGYAIYDLGAPIFVFVSGLSFCYSFRSLLKKMPESKALYVLLMRGFKTIGIGGLLFFAPNDAVGIISISMLGAIIVFAIICLILKSTGKNVTKTFFVVLNVSLAAFGIAITFVGVLDNILFASGIQVLGTHWSALCSIGFSMIVSIPFVRLSLNRKLIGAFLLTVFYLCLNLLIPMGFFTHWTHGGLLGSFGFALLFYYAHTLVELSDKNKYLSWYFALILTFTAFVAVGSQTPSKSAVNFSYVLTSFFFSYAIYIVVQLFDGIKVNKSDILTVLGRNSLLVYLLHSFVTFPIGICINALVAYLGLNQVLSALLCVVCMICYVLLMTSWIYRLNKKGFALKM